MKRRVPSLTARVYAVIEAAYMEGDAVLVASDGDAELLMRWARALVRAKPWAVVQATTPKRRATHDTPRAKK